MSSSISAGISGISGTCPWPCPLPTPLELLRGKHFIRLNNPIQSGGPRGLGIAQEPILPPKSSFQIDGARLGCFPQREPLAEAVGIACPLVLVVQPGQCGLV